MTRVLVVEDDRRLLRAMGINLRARRYEVDLAATGTAALEAAARRLPDVVVLDLGLPDLDGLDVIAGLRGWSTVPIVVLSARHTQDDKVTALDAGADDYVTKPFGMDELLARIRAAVRRGRGASASDGAAGESPVVHVGRHAIDLAARTVRGAEGADVRLTPTEWRLLEALVRRPGRLVEQGDLLREVWGPQYGTESHYLRQYVARLRRKLEADPSRPRHLVTEPGLGYRYDPDG